MSTEGAASWSAALAQFDRLQDLPDDLREAALQAMERVSPELVARVRGLFAADARNADTESGVIPASVPRAAPRVAGYVVRGILGYGGMGEVYAAERTGVDFMQPVALKRMHAGRNAAEVHKRFLQERRILAQLNHPHIARLLDGGLDDEGNPYFAMERVDGVAITDYVKNSHLDLRAILQLFVVVCEAVAYAHRNLIVHRDIKPSNVLVDTGGSVKLLDFGIAKLLDPEHDTATLSLAMTPAYAAPEQLLGEAISTATDVYSLGLLLYELLTGGLPARSWRERLRDATGEFDTLERPSNDILQRGDGDPRDRRRLAQQLRGDLDQIVLTALRRDPARRYSGAQALGDDLQRYLGGRPVRASADTLRYRAGKFIRRNAVAVAAASLLAFVLIAATAMSIGFARRERIARAEAEAQARHALHTRDFVVSLFNDINPTDASQGKGKEYTAVQLLKAAAERVDTALADTPDTQAELRSALASALLQFSDYPAALALSDAAVAQLRILHGDHSLLLADALTTRAQIQENLSNLTASQADAEAAIAATAELPDDKAVQLSRIRTRTTLAILASFRNDVEGALRQNQAILMDRTALLGRDDDPALAVDLNNIATLNLRLERYVDAEASYRRAAALFSAANGDEHPRMIWLYNGIAYALLGQGLLDAARAQSDHALALATSKLGAENGVILSIQVGQGRIARLQGDYARADAAFEAAVAIGKKLNHPQWAGAELQYALSQLDQRHYTQAEALLVSSLAHTRALAGDKPDSGVLQATVARGLVMARLGRPAEGAALAQPALQRLQAKCPLEKKRLAETQALYAQIPQETRGN